MASTYTSRIRLEKQGDGENANTWGLRLNENVIELIDEAISGYKEIDLSGGAVTLTANNGSDDEARNFGLKLTGSLSANTTVTIPAQEKIYFINNQTTGSHTVFIKNAGGTAVSVVDQGFSSMVATNGTSITSFEEPDTSGFATTTQLAATSAALQSDIDTNTAITVALSATLESRIAGVSTTMATSIANVSATLESRIATVSSTLAASIADVKTSVQFATSATTAGSAATAAFASSATNATFATTATDATKVYVSGTGASGSYRVALADTGNSSGHYSLYKDSGGQFYYNPSSNQLNVGSVVASGELTAYSDERLKENVETLDGSKAFEMRGVSFVKDGKESSGVIAQEIEKVAPELITENGGYKSVAYGNVVGYLIEAVKLLKEEIEELKGK